MKYLWNLINIHLFILIPSRQQQGKAIDSGNLESQIDNNIYFIWTQKLQA
jgi:hypothetical protein